MHSSSPLPLAPLTRLLAVSAVIFTIGCGGLPEPIETVLDRADVLTETARDALLEVEDEFREIDPCPAYEGMPELFRSVLRRSIYAPYSNDVDPPARERQPMFTGSCRENELRADGVRAGFHATLERLEDYRRITDNMRTFLTDNNGGLHEELVNTFEEDQRKLEAMRTFFTEMDDDATEMDDDVNAFYGPIFADHYDLLVRTISTAITDQEGPEARDEFFAYAESEINPSDLPQEARGMFRRWFDDNRPPSSEDAISNTVSFFIGEMERLRANVEATREWAAEIAEWRQQSWEGPDYTPTPRSNWRPLRGTWSGRLLHPQQPVEKVGKFGPIGSI